MRSFILSTCNTTRIERAWKLYLCQINPVTERICLEAKDMILAMLETLNDRLFPNMRSNVSRTLSCSHIFTLCDDYDMNGRKLNKNEWSCKSCESILYGGIEVFKAPLKKINEAAATYLCGDSPECRTQVAQVFHIGGVLGDVLREQRDIEEVCRSVMGCR
ncbi:unnamed protein product [Auanema sp. JU1783]|nr:unnamed protein product [Auanema sp. JU1783]